MQKILNLVNKAIKEFELIQNGDNIAVALSGGKDSLVLLACLCQIKKYFKIKFDLIAITVGLKFDGFYTDFSNVLNFCKSFNVPYFFEKSEISEIVFDIRHEKSACSLCSKMRKGLINSVAKKYGCNKVALGHNLDDVVETFLMNLFSSGRLACFPPKTHLSRQNITQIRPLIFVSEQQSLDLALKLKLPVVSSRCYVDGKTNREVVKKFLKREELEFKNIKKLVFGAIRRSGFKGW